MHKDNNKKAHCLHGKLYYSNCEQSYALPDDVERDKILANIENCVLHMKWPPIKPQQTEP